MPSSVLYLIAILFLPSENINGQNGTTSKEDALLSVTIANGQLRGKTIPDRNGNHFYAYQKIPFARAPTSNLRYKAPQTPDNWTGVLDATQVAPDCVQNNAANNISEDCLYLNVFTHRSSEAQPVMVYIYGGAFVVGSSNPESNLGPEFLLTRDIVLVTLNYRLGLLGFLSYEGAEDASMRTEISANNGLKDQIAALEWIQRNIHQFGGDPFRVTIFGNSAGAISAHLLLLSPLGTNLFHRAIIQSGTALSKGLAQDDTAVVVGKMLEVDTSNNTELLRVLRSLDVKQIQSLQDKLDLDTLTRDVQTPVGVVIERPSPTSFLSANPWELIRTGNYTRRPTMFGLLDAEGIIFYVYRFLKNTTRYFDTEAFVPYYYNQREFAGVLLDEDFFPAREYDDIERWVELWGASSFAFDIVRCLLEHVRFDDVYFYEFRVDAQLNWSKLRARDAARIKGACHGDELGYIFKMQSTPRRIEAGSVEDLTIDRMVALFTNFAKGDVLSVVDYPTLEWQPVRNASEIHTMVIDEELSQELFDLQRVAYWRRFYDAFNSGVL